LIDLGGSHHVVILILYTPPRGLSRAYKHATERPRKGISFHLILHGIKASFLMELIHGSIILHYRYIALLRVCTRDGEAHSRELRYVAVGIN
jgi:hypothetical protein